MASSNVLSAHSQDFRFTEPRRNDIGAFDQGSAGLAGRGPPSLLQPALRATRLAAAARTSRLAAVQCFKTFIVSGGGFECLSVFVERTYGIPPERETGSSDVVKFELGADGKPVLVKEAKGKFVDGGRGKPMAVNRFIGRRPPYRVRAKCACERESHVGRLDRACGAANATGRAAIDMKRDWKRAFAFEREPRRRQDRCSRRTWLPPSSSCRTAVPELLGGRPQTSGIVTRSPAC